MRLRNFHKKKFKGFEIIWERCSSNYFQTYFKNVLIFIFNYLTETRAKLLLDVNLRDLKTDLHSVPAAQLRSVVFYIDIDQFNDVEK